MSALHEPLAVFYRPEMSIDKKNFSPSAGKPRLVVSDWLKKDAPITVRGDFEPVAQSLFYEVHARPYVDGVFAGTILNGFDDYDPAVPRACSYTASSMLNAAAHALSRPDGIACSPSSGFHHAGFNGGHGYCTFNSLALTALHFAQLGLRVAILDCDYHFGDGTADILARRPLGVLHYSVGDTGPRGLNRDEPKRFFDDLNSALKEIAHSQIDLVLYQAGADMHINDPLGGLLSSAAMLARDQKVFRATALCGAAICWNLAGGYRRNPNGGLEPVLDLHRRTLAAALEGPFQRDSHSPVYATRAEARSAALSARRLA